MLPAGVFAAAPGMPCAGYHPIGELSEAARPARHAPVVNDLNVLRLAGPRTPACAARRDKTTAKRKEDALAAHVRTMIHDSHCASEMNGLRPMWFKRAERWISERIA